MSADGLGTFEGSDTIDQDRGQLAAGLSPAKRALLAQRLKLASRYRCVGNDAPMELFVTSEGVAETGSRSLGWAVLHNGSLRIHEIAGGHISMVKEPHVSEVADRFARSLQSAQAETGVT